MADNFDVTKWNRNRYIAENELNAKNKRYVAVIDFYVWAEDDEDAKQQAIQIAKDLADKEDNRAQLIQLASQPTGTLGNREIKLENQDIKLKAKEEEDKIGDKLFKAVTGEEPKTSTKNKLRAPKNEIKVNTPPQVYVVGYWEYYNDSWEGDYVEVKAVSEEDAIEKAKQMVPRATKGFKAKLK